MEFARLVSRLVPKKVVDAYVAAEPVGGSAGLDASQLRSALSSLGIPVEDAQASMLLLQYDVDKDTRVGLLGFTSLAAHLQRQRQWWRRWR